MNLLWIAKKSPIPTEIQSYLEANDFQVQCLSAAEAVSEQLRCVACGIIICDVDALSNQDIPGFLATQNTPHILLLNQENLPLSLESFRLGMRIKS